MSKKQFVLVFIIVLSVWSVGQGLSPLLPVHALHLGARPSIVGLYMAFVSLMLSLGGLAAGWLSDRTGRRKVWILLGNLVAPASLYGMSQTQSLWSYAVFTGLTWFSGGTGVAFSMISVGLQADQSERGKLFGILSIVASLGALLGGAIYGPAADRWGYPGMFLLAGGVYAAPTPLLLLLRDPRTTERRTVEKRASRRFALGRQFYVLLLASFIASVGGSVVNMTRSLAMHGAGFDAAAIASTVMAFGLVSLPLRPIAGWLSDRLGRKQVMVWAFMLSFLGRCAFIPAARLWHFWSATALLSMIALANPIKSAWASDLSPREALGRAISQTTVSGWAGGVVGNLLGGLAIETLGIPWTFAATSLSMLVAIGLLLSIRKTVAGEAQGQQSVSGPAVPAHSSGAESPLPD